jgi:hypothetical protein
MPQLQLRSPLCLSVSVSVCLSVCLCVRLSVCNMASDVDCHLIGATPS